MSSESLAYPPLDRTRLREGYKLCVGNARRLMSDARALDPLSVSSLLKVVVDSLFTLAALGVLVSLDWRLTLVLTAALALRAYRAEHGAYPQDLKELTTAKELAPAYLNKIPEDTYLGR